MNYEETECWFLGSGIFCPVNFIFFRTQSGQSEPIPLSPAREEGKLRTAPALGHQAPVGTGMGLFQAGTPVHMWGLGWGPMKGISSRQSWPCTSNVFCLLLWYKKLASLESFCQNYCHVPGTILTHWLHLSIKPDISGSLAWNSLFKDCLRVTYMSSLSGFECQFNERYWRSMKGIEKIVCGFMWLLFCPFFYQFTYFYFPPQYMKTTQLHDCVCCFVGVFLMMLPLENVPL